MKGRSILLKLASKGISVKHDAGKLKFFGDLSSLNADDKAQIVAAKAQIIDYLNAQNNSEMVIKPIDAEQLPLSFAQQRLAFIDKLQGGSPEYNMPMAFDVQGSISLSLLNRVFTTIIERHSILRTVYQLADDQIVQCIKPMKDVHFAIEQQDLRHLTHETISQSLEQYIETDALKAFDLSADLMLRVSFIKTDDNSGVLLFNMHHIASDGWSMELLIKEFFTLYEAYSQGKSDPLPPLGVQYGDYAHWQQQHNNKTKIQGQIDYWLKQLDDVPLLHDLPLDFERQSAKLPIGKTVASELESEVAGELLELAKQLQVTPFMLLHGALALLLSRHSNSHDIVIGTPVANRLMAQLEPMIGFFVNSLVLRVDTSKATIKDYFAHIKQVHLDAQSNQDVPFEQLVEHVKIPRSTAHAPLFQILLTTNTDYGLASQNIDSFSLSDVVIKARDADMGQEKFDLTVDLSISPKGLGLSWRFNSALFSADHIEKLDEHMRRLLTQLAQLAQLPKRDQHGQISPAQLNLLSDDETYQLLHGLNKTVTVKDDSGGFNSQACLHQLFEQQAAQNPHAIGAEFEGQQLSYQALNAKANQLAHYLMAHHQLQSEQLVGLCVSRSLEMIIGILAILKAGGAYVPMDPDYPKERLDFMIEDGELELVLTEQHLVDCIAGFKGQMICIDEMATRTDHFCARLSQDNIGQENVNIQSQHLTQNNLAYVIYTSGSTGKPKGVMVEHRNAVAMLSWARQAYADEELAVVLASTSLNFDLSIYELFLPLSSGNTIKVVTNIVDWAVAGDLAGVSLINTVPSALDALLKLDVALDEVKVINVAGEPLQKTLVNRTLAAYPSLAMCNLYGPSEDTTYSTYARFERPLVDTPHIGKVIDNTYGYVLDKDLQLLPFGAIGELYLGGSGVTRGYLNRDELTAERYIDNPFADDGASEQVPKRLYRTGDLVRYLPDGNFAFIGRVDEQVKIRGFRIELGEVESQLNQLSEIVHAVVLATDVAHSKQLVAYIELNGAQDDKVASLEPIIEQTAEQTVEQTVEKISQLLAERLPSNMLPSMLIPMSQWPLTANGKVNKKALPQPSIDAMQGTYVAPQTDTEQQLVDIWATLLNVDAKDISTKVSFFSLGGHSLMIVRLIGAIKQAFGLELDVQGLYEVANVAELAELCDGLLAKQQVKQRIDALDESEIEEVEF